MDPMICVCLRAERALASDPEFLSEKGQSLRLLLYIFERDQALRLLRAG